MNLPNQLTMSRIAIMPIFIFALYEGGLFWHIIAFLCFLYASFSDFLDGVIARRNQCVTDFGKFMDPLADKIFISAAFITFVDFKVLNIPAWMVTIILSREFMITGLRTLAISKGVVIAAQKSGKFKTSAQLLAIFVILLICIYYDLEQNGIYTLSQNLRHYVEIVPNFLMLIITVLTFFSGLTYMYSNRSLLKS